MTQNHNDGYAGYIKYFVIAVMTAAWISAAWTGFMLGVVPYSTGGGDEILLGYTRAELGTLHSWLSVIAVGITAVEIIISRKSLREGIRYLTEPHGGNAAE
jgi:hypothetical protein